MKTKLIILMVVLALLWVFSSANAQQAVSMERMRLGFGVSLGKEVLEIGEVDQLNMVDFPSFYLPLQLMPTLRVEPQFGYYKHTVKNSFEESRALMDLGIGLFLQTWYGNVDLYYGGRIGWFKTKLTYDDGVDKETQSRSNLYLGPAFGGEYFFTSHLSIGGEIQFLYTKIGEWDVDKDGGNGNARQVYIADEEKITETLLRTKTLVFVRWYL